MANVLAVAPKTRIWAAAAETGRTKISTEKRYTAAISLEARIPLAVAWIWLNPHLCARHCSADHWTARGDFGQTRGAHRRSHGLLSMAGKLWICGRLVGLNQDLAAQGRKVKDWVT